MKIFYTNYHISVNKCFVDDLSALKVETLVPTQSFAKDPNGHIGFFAPNDEHYGKPYVTPIEYDQFLAIKENIGIVVNCSQLYDDMMKLYRQRGERDTLIMLSSQGGLGEWMNEKPDWKSDYVIGHSLNWHRKSPAKYRFLYFNRPNVLVEPKTPEEIRKTFDEKKIRLYINHFETALAYLNFESFTGEQKAAHEFREAWLKQTGWRIPFYGFENKDGYLTMQQTQDYIKDSMFTLVFKGHETWGQMVNESMLIGTPVIMLEQFIVDMFTQYLITQDTAIIGKSVSELIEKINNLTFEQYEVLVMEAQSHSEMFCNKEVRLKKLSWFLSKLPL